MFSVYILYSHRLDKYYIGSTSDLEGRLHRHHTANHGFTSTGKPWILVFTESHISKTEALKRENQLKAWKNKDRIKALINKSDYPE
jgi:putative endonuclease